MRQLRDIAEQVRDFLETFARIHVGPLVTAAGALVADLALGANAQAKIMFGLACGMAVLQFLDWSGRAGRKRGEQVVAHSARSVLAAHLTISPLDFVTFGEVTTLRRLAHAARTGRLNKFFGFGAPARNLARDLWDLSAGFENDIGRCYERLRPRAKARVDIFADSLKTTASAADQMLNVPLGEEREAAARRLTDAVDHGLRAIEEAGDALDRYLDPAGFAADLASRTAHAEDVSHRRERALEVLIANAGRAGAQLGGVPLPGDPRFDLENVTRCVRNALDIGLHVDSSEYGEASEEARAAHHRVVYDDLLPAMEACNEMARADVAEGNGEKIRELLGRLPEDVANVERLAQASRAEAWRRGLAG